VTKVSKWPHICAAVNFLHNSVVGRSGGNPIDVQRGGPGVPTPPPIFLGKLCIKNAMKVHFDATLTQLWVSDATLTLLWCYSDATLTLLWRSSDAPLKLLWRNSDATLTLLWRNSDATLTLLWRYPDATLHPNFFLDFYHLPARPLKSTLCTCMGENNYYRFLRYGEYFLVCFFLASKLQSAAWSSLVNEAK
jgi:hypothetical protein